MRGCLRGCLITAAALIAVMAGLMWYLYYHGGESDPQTAERMASQFLAKHSLDTKDFEGPEVNTHGKIWTYEWKTRDPSRKLRLAVSPAVDMFVLYKEIDEHHVQAIIQEIPE